MHILKCYDEQFYGWNCSILWAYISLAKSYRFIEHLFVCNVYACQLPYLVTCPFQRAVCSYLPSKVLSIVSRRNGQKIKRDIIVSAVTLKVTEILKFTCHHALKVLIPSLHKATSVSSLLFRLNHSTNAGQTENLSQLKFSLFNEHIRSMGKQPCRCTNSGKFLRSFHLHMRLTRLLQKFALTFNSLRKFARSHSKNYYNLWVGHSVSLRTSLLCFIERAQ